MNWGNMKASVIAAMCLVPIVVVAQEANDPAQGNFVDLSDSAVAPQSGDDGSSHVLSNAWWQNLDIYGFAAAGYYDTGTDGTRQYGGFEIKEATLFIETTVWENAAVFFELQTNRLGKDDQLFTRTGEVYLHFRDLPIGNNFAVGVKLGRIDIPFGEEYLWQDAVDNPLITNSAAYPYGWDEGVLVYGNVGDWQWIAAITDGTDARSSEENSDKALNLKVGRQIGVAHVSVSAMRNGDGTKSAIEFGGSHFQPVGASHGSSLGASPSTQVGASLYQVDAKLDLDTAYSGYVAVAAGFADQSDSAPGFDRDFRWFSIEPMLRLTTKAYVIARFSEIGTQDSLAGYHFDGKTFAGGNSTFGYDVKSFRRLAIGLGWQPNPRVVAKLEVGRDRFDLIAASTVPNPGRRNFVGFEVAASF